MIYIRNCYDKFCINLTGFKKLYGSQLLKEIISYIINSLKLNLSEIENKKIMILGCGGAGKAVSAFFSKEIEKGDLYLTSKNKKNKAYSEKLENTTWVDWDKKQEFLNNDLAI